MSTEPVDDLRSDTVTRPGRAMREAMADATLGDALDGPRAQRVVSEARARGVLLNDTGPSSLRAVTHLDLTAADVERAAERLCDAILALRGAPR